MRMLKAAGSRGRYCRLPKMARASDQSFGFSVNTILSGSRTLTRTRILGQCKCKCALIETLRVLAGLSGYRFHSYQLMIL